MEQKIQEFTQKINDCIEQLDLVQEPRELYLPVAYSLHTGGKRIRPLMTLLACDMFGGDVDRALYPALGLEVFHNFTLLHDDIMDNASMRRGRPAVHVKWSPNAAILSGDAMFALAYQYMLHTPDAALRQVLEIFNRTVVEVCEGQQYDMDFENMDAVSEAQYLNMIRLKTAVLPAACLQIGALLANASDADALNLYKFGEYIGMAFQIKDDWLDVFGQEAQFGKKTGGDIVANKKTWLYVKAFDLANEQQMQVLHNAFTNRIYNTEEKIRVVKDIYLQLGVNDLAIACMEKYYEEAFAHLAKVSLPAESKQGLDLLARNLFSRDK